MSSPQVLLAALALLWPVCARAETSDEAAPQWEVGLTAYFWASGMNGNVGTIEGAQPVAVDMSFGDIFKQLKFAGMAMVQARHDRFVMDGDIQFVSLSGSKSLSIRDADLLDGHLDTSTFIGSALAGYRVTQTPRVTIDLMAGGRVNSVKNKLKLSGPLRSVEGKVTQTWVDPIVGAQVSVPVSSKTSLALYGDVGGFGVSSHFTWQLLGAVQYDFSHHWRASAGWRHYAVDYRNGAFLYDVALSGPILGIRYSF